MTDLLLKFSGLNFRADISFWSSLYDNKLNVYKSEKIKTDIIGELRKQNGRTFVQLSSDSFDNMENSNDNTRILYGDIFIVNTIEELKKISLIQNKTTMTNMWDHIKSGVAFNDHRLFNKLTMSVYIDLKKYKFAYWVAFPILKIGYKIHYEDRTSLFRVMPSSTEREIVKNQILNIWTVEDPDISIFIYNNLTVEGLTFQHVNDPTLTELVLIINDMGATLKHPSCLVRNMLFAIAYHISNPIALTLICLREDGLDSIDDSICYTIHMTPLLESELKFNKNDIPEYYDGFIQLSQHGKVGTMDISESMDTNKLAESALTLNNTLMKWNVAPNLNLDNIASKKCLLIGAGTLGCHVARNLLGWGVTNITFMDCGTISYSNPARQTLFNQEDIGKNKAETAAINLQKIYGSVNSTAINLKIPMPGYAIADERELQKQLEMLDQSIRDHDIIFLLTDTRESRWLPTLLANTYKKMCFTAAIGFDSFVAMRHGKMDNEEGDDLGCYFCTDSLEPSNTVVNATMDKRCTVSRPGISFMASSMVTELMVSCVSSMTDPLETLTSIDKIPQQIRGNISTFDVKYYHTQKSRCCMACSDKVFEEFKKGPFDFVKEAITQEGYLTKLLDLNVDDIDIDYLSSDDNDNETVEDVQISRGMIDASNSLIEVVENNFGNTNNTDEVISTNDETKEKTKEEAEDSSFANSLSNVEKKLLLPIIYDVANATKFVNRELAIEIYNSYDAEEQESLMKYYETMNAYDWDGDY